MQKCPICGSMIEEEEVCCPICGHAFTITKSFSKPNSTIKKTPTVRTASSTSRVTKEKKEFKLSDLGDKVWPIILLLLIVMFAVWLAPANDFSKEFRDDLREDCEIISGCVDEKKYNEIYKSYVEGSPNLYNLFFGGQKEIVYSNSVITLDYDNLVQVGLQCAFIFHVLAILLCAIAYFTSSKIFKSAFIVILCFAAVLFYVFVINTYNGLPGILMIRKEPLEPKDITLGFGCWGSMILYVITIILGVNFYNSLE